MLKTRIKKSPIIMFLLATILILNGILPTITVVNAEASIVSPYNIYFGDLHRHTTHSDGWQDIYEVLGDTTDYAQEEKNAGRDANIDFLAITDHNVSMDGIDEYREIKTAVNYFNNLYEGEFLGIAGMENNYDGGRHINTFGNDINEVGWRLGGGWPYPDFHDFVDDNNLIGQFNHPTDENDHYDFQMFENVKDNMCLVETACVNDSIDGAYEWKYVLALDKGWRVAPTVNSDHTFEHNDSVNGNGGVLGRWTKEARTAILATSLTRDSFYEAMRARRVYATLDKNLEINYTVNGYPMGSEIMAKANGTVDINLNIKDGDATTRVESVQLFTNTGEVFYSFDLTGHNSNIEDLSVTLPIFGFHDTDRRYLYAKVIVQDEANERKAAWTAPVWVQATPEYKNEAFNKPVTSSNNVYKENIVDGNPATYWASNLNGENEWVTIDLQERKDIIGFKLYMLTQASIVNHFKVQASNNGSEWTTLYDTSEHGPNLEGGILEVHFAPINYRYFRMQSTTINEPWGYAINEFKVFSQGTFPDSAPPSLNFSFDGQSPGSSQVNYIIYGEPVPQSVGNYHIVVDDPDVSLENNKITRVEVRLVNENESEAVIKTYNTNSHHVEINGDVLSLMNPNYPDDYNFDMSQVFKIVAYQGASMMSYYVSNNIGVNITQNAEPYFTILPFNMDPYYVDHYDPWGDYPIPTAVYNCPYAISQIADQNKIPKFKIKINDTDNYDSDKVVLLQVLKLNSDGAGDTIVKEIHYNESEQRTKLSIEVPAAECMGNDISAQFIVRVTNKAGMVFTSAPIGAIWNILDTEPWIRFDVTDVPSVATYEGQRLSYMGDRNAVKNANPKFHIELEGNRIINKVEIVDFNDVAIWTKDISVLNTTEFNYDVNLLPLIISFNYYRVKATSNNGIGYYSDHIKTDWMSWVTSTAPLPLQVNGYPAGLENVTVYSDEAPCFKVNYIWYGTSQTEVNRINIKNSAGTIVYTLTIDGTVSQSYNVPIEGLMSGVTNKSFYAEFVYKNGGGSYKTANVNITYINKVQPSITFRPFGLNPVNGAVTYTSNNLPNQIPEETRPKFHIEVSGVAVSYKDNIQRVELIDGNNNVVKAENVSNQNSSNIILDWNTLECLNGSLSGTYKIRIINKDCKIFESQWIQAAWDCTNTADTSFTANIEPDATTGIIDLASIPEEITPIFNINVTEADELEGFKLDKVELISEDYYGGQPEQVVLAIEDINNWNVDLSKNIIEAINGEALRTFHVRATNESGQVFDSNSIIVRNERPYFTFKLQGMGLEGYPDGNGNVYITSDLLPAQIENGEIFIEKSFDYDAELWTTDGQQINYIDWKYDLGEAMGNKLDRSFYVVLNNIYTGRRYVFEPIRVVWNCTNTAEISFTADGQEVGATVTLEGSVEEISQAGTGKFNINIQEADSSEQFNITQIDVVKANGETAKTLTVNSRSIDTQVDITECMLAGTNESFHLVVKNAAGQEFTTGDIAVNWIYNEKSIVNFYINQNSTVVQQYYLGAPDEQLEGRPTFHISVNDPDNNGNEIVTKVEIKRKRDNKVVKSYNVAEQNSRSFDADVDIFQLLNYSVYECYYVTVTYSGQQNTNSREIHVCWNQPSEIELTSDLQSDNGEITINSQYSPQEAEQLGLSPEFYVMVNGIDSFYENIIQKIEIVNTAGEVVDSRDYNDFIYSTEEYFSIAKCLGSSTSGEFSARVTLYDGNTYIAPESLKVNWIADHSPTIDFTVYGRGEGTTVYIPEESLPGKGPKLIVRVTDQDNTDRDIISKVELLTTNGAVIKIFNVLVQNSRSISINEEITQYIEQGYNYFSTRVTNKGGKVYTTGGIYVYYGNSSGDEYE